MTSYWVSYRIHDSDGYQHTYAARRDNLIQAIKAACGNGHNWWFETTSFFVFVSADNIDALAARLKAAIDPDVDLVVIGMNEIKGGRVVGNCKDQDIYALFPGIVKAS